MSVESQNIVYYNDGFSIIHAPRNQHKPDMFKS